MFRVRCKVSKIRFDAAQAGSDISMCHPPGCPIFSLDGATWVQVVSNLGDLVRVALVAGLAWYLAGTLAHRSPSGLVDILSSFDQLYTGLACCPRIPGNVRSSSHCRVSNTSAPRSATSRRAAARNGQLSRDYQSRTWEVGAHKSRRLRQ